MVFVLFSEAAVTLAIFDAPRTAKPSRLLLRAGLVRPEARNGKNCIVSFFEDFALAQDLSLALDAKEWSGSGQPDGGLVDGPTRQFAGIHRSDIPYPPWPQGERLPNEGLKEFVSPPKLLLLPGISCQEPALPLSWSWF
jgi:hypothetical protein